MDKPDGPLTLRVYPGANCEGSVYQDDGTSFAYKRGVYFRQHFTCSESAEGAVTAHLDTPEGSFSPWWNEVRVEVYGLGGAKRKADSAGKTIKVESEKAVSAVVMPASKTFTEVTFH
jgi:alpha-glucosidase